MARMITHGIGNVEFVTRSVRRLDESAASLAREIQEIDKYTTAMVWQGPDRLDFDRKKDALVAELRALQEFIKAKATELDGILTAQFVASGRT